jgi:hypothetical protein
MRSCLALVVLTLLGVAPAAAVDLPTRKAGLWELKMVFEGRNLPIPSMQHCTDPSTDKLMTSSFGNASQETCSKKEINKVGDTMVVDSVCQVGASKVTSHAVVSGDFNSAYTVKVTATREGGPAIPGQPAGGASVMTVDAKWLGPCKADQKAGDVIMSNGFKMNVVDKSVSGLPGNLRPPPPK